MDNLANYCFQIFRSQGISDLRSRRGNYDTVPILRGAALSIRPSKKTEVIWMPPDGVLGF